MIIGFILSQHGLPNMVKSIETMAVAKFPYQILIFIVGSFWGVNADLDCLYSSEGYMI